MTLTSKQRAFLNSQAHSLKPIIQIGKKMCIRDSYGNIPQNRERIYIVGFDTKEAYDLFEFPEEIKLTTSLQDVINFGDTLDEVYYYRCLLYTSRCV